MSCFMVINGSCSTNICARQLSFNFSSMVWGGGMAPWPPFGSAPVHQLLQAMFINDTYSVSTRYFTQRPRRIISTSLFIFGQFLTFALSQAAVRSIAISVSVCLLAYLKKQMSRR